MINAKKMLMSTLAAVAFSFEEKQKVETFWELVKRYVWPLR